MTENVGQLIVRVEMELQLLESIKFREHLQRSDGTEKGQVPHVATLPLDQIAQNGLDRFIVREVTTNQAFNRWWEMADRVADQQIVGNVQKGHLSRCLDHGSQFLFRETTLTEYERSELSTNGSEICSTSIQKTKQLESG